MAQTYTLSECRAMLNVDYKTFQRWLDKAGIDTDNQVSRFDSRVRFLTQEQLEKLAADHERTLTPVEQRPQESVAQGLVKLLADRLDSAEHQIAQAATVTYVERLEARVDSLEDAFTTAKSAIDTLSGELKSTRELLGTALERIAALEQQRIQDSTWSQERVSTLEQQQAADRELLTSTGAQLASTQERVTTLEQTPRRTRTAPLASESAGEGLPDGLVSWRAFADLHHVSQSTAGRRIQTGSIHIVKGSWKVGTRVVKEALDAKGQRELWVQFHSDEHFLTCDDCPHEVPGN